MTAEIAILNKEAVAMAADSAVTVSTAGGQKILPSANKIFSLSKFQPVGIMVYGNATLMGTPWETIIKMFRQKLGNHCYDKLSQYADKLLDYLKESLFFYPEDTQLEFVLDNTFRYLSDIQDEIKEKAEVFLKKKKKNGISEKEGNAIITSIFKAHNEYWTKRQPSVNNYSEEYKSFKKKYYKVFQEVKKELFIKLTPLQSRYVNNIFIMMFLKSSDDINMYGISGVVISGFGKQEIYPSIQSYQIKGVANNLLIYSDDYSSFVDHNHSAGIIPFAQKDMVFSFMEGINPRLNHQIIDLFDGLLKGFPKLLISKLSLTPSEKKRLEKEFHRASALALRKTVTALKDYRRKNFVDPILEVVDFLSKIELAEMAEALVNLSALKKRISMEDETVGGPIDVVVISKGDGLIWIKRKHYFEQSLNQHFFNNYYNFDNKSCSNEKQDEQG